MDLSINTDHLIIAAQWVDSGCKIHHFFIRYKPWNNKQWIQLNRSMANSPKIVLINNLQAAKRYNLFISASSDAGITEAEYDFYTNNSSYLYSVNGLSKNANLFSQASPSSSAQFFRQYMTILMPVTVSILIIVTLFAAMLFCLRKQNLFNANQVEVSAFDRMSCNSNVNSKCDSGADGMPLSDYQCLPKLKTFNDEPQSMSYYSSPARKNSAENGINTAIKTHSGTNNHEYAEPFMRLNRNLPDQYGCNLLSQEKIGYQQHYASIKKNKFIRPSTLMNN